MAPTVCWSHALVNGQTSKRPASDGGISEWVYVVGSCWWCGQLSVLARLTHMPHCPPVPTSSWMPCTDRPQFAVYFGSSSVFGADLLPWCLLQGPIRGGVLGWARMLPTPASMLPQSTHPSTGPQGWHLASPEPTCCRVYGTWVCMGALRSLSCRAGCASRLSLPSVPRQGWLLSALGRQGLSLLRQGDGPQRAVDCDVNLPHVWASAPDRGTVFSCREYKGLRGDPQCFGRGSPGYTSKTTDDWESRCNFPATSSRCCLKFSIRSRRSPRCFGAFWNTWLT